MHDFEALNISISVCKNVRHEPQELLWGFYNHWSVGFMMENGLIVSQWQQQESRLVL